MSEVRDALAEDHPLQLLAYASAVMAAFDPGSRHPFEPQDAESPSLEELVDTLLDVPMVETSAVLSAIATLTPDELLQGRIRAELARRGDPLPQWLLDLDRVQVYRAGETVQVLRDGDNVFVGSRFPGGQELTALTYIDHNLGTVVKDAFVVAEPMADLIAIMRSKTDDPDVSWNDLDPADARARIAEAVKIGAMTFPPFETDTWPAARPLLDWLIRHLPPGGQGYQRPVWSKQRLATLSRRLFDSTFAARLATGSSKRDYHELLDDVLWFATDYGPGDPLRWSPSAVEILLTDWIPRKIVADADLLAPVPTLLRAFIRYCHAERGIRPALTEQTIAAVDRFEPEYQRLIRTPRPQGAAALLAAIGAMNPYDGDSADDGPPALDDLDDLEDLEDLEDLDEHALQAMAADAATVVANLVLDSLRSQVGGDAALHRLDDRPLPDEPFDWTGISDDIHARVDEVLALADQCCDALFDAEYRTACRRLLARAARDGPEMFRRRARPEPAAAALCWIIAKANDGFGPRLRAKDLGAHFNVGTSYAQRAPALLTAADLPEPREGTPLLGSPDYLVAVKRRQITEQVRHFEQVLADPSSWLRSPE